MYLYEEIEVLKKADVYKELPSYISDNLNTSFELRPYQKTAFQNFITYFENEKLKIKPSHTLFHMATGSGKTMIMAGLMLYLYKQGYRNFLFFVSLSNIVKKTKENFLNNASSKYLFADEISIDGERIKIREVDNFQYSDPDSINICFSTIQGLHTNIGCPKENSVTEDDFKELKTVLISDEAHHLNAATKNKDQQKDEQSWEYTVNRIFNANLDNILLEFTATCDIKKTEIKKKYEPKIIFDYPLVKFREELYSKEIKTLRTDSDADADKARMNRALQACVLSQYRLKIFQDNYIQMKPVVLFKSYNIAGSKAFMEEFIGRINSLCGNDLELIAQMSQSEILNTAYTYFRQKEISFDILAQEMRNDFSMEHCISANEGDAEKNQILLNSLENSNNPYRAVFAVNKLDEGWDVLNLFDIVRLYETRQSGGKKISQTTISEAQLIGRGARYCPFAINPDDSKYKRKYDNDVNNPLRVCEELYYHCKNDSRYIDELRKALREIGAEADRPELHYKLKDIFKADTLYKSGVVFKNSKIIKKREDIDGLPWYINKNCSVRLSIGEGGEDVILEDDNTTDTKVKLYTCRNEIKEIAQKNYMLLHKALRQYAVFEFNTLQGYFPKLNSIRDFITSDKYLGNVEIALTSKYENPPTTILYSACLNALGKIALAIADIKDTEGSTEFYAYWIHEIFKDKTISYTATQNGGIGVSQKDHSVETNFRLDLDDADWFAYNDNYGTTEEKAFVQYFSTYIDKLKEQYDKVYLVRNERQLALYSFDNGERFEPDYLIFLQKNKEVGYEQYQIFVEPKGEFLFETDKWKEDFLKQIEERGIPTKTFADDTKYHVWGLPFYNHNSIYNKNDDRKFTEAFEKVFRL